MGRPDDSRSRRRFVAAVGCALASTGCLTRTPETTPGRETDRPTVGTTATRETVPTGWLDEYETVEVQIQEADGRLRGTVTAAIADTPDLRYRGLSDAPGLPPDTGMLFLYEEPADRTFVMRRMSFGIDIVYADSDRSITRIHHAPEPGPGEDGDEQRYPGYGQYVLELPYEWTDEHGVEMGDVLAWE